MGKHRGRGSTAKRPAAPKGDALVVVNPSMLHSAARTTPKPQQNGKKKQQNQPKKRKANKDGSDGPKTTQKKRKKTQEDKAIVSNVKVSSAAKLSREEGGGASCTVLRVKKDVDFMTVWDAEYFVFISSSGRVTWCKKNQLLSLSLASLQCLVPALRSWTAACGGHMPVNSVLRAIQLCCQLGSGDKRPTDNKLPPKTLKRIMSFTFGGSARLWRQIAKLSTLEEETVYDSQ
ncbi:Ankyrin-2 [Phytophthora nicotianae]|uniref:Ankyrin-2 n=1 Tax=Phytophthora nicotianae TaxID=4792 RepID=A0A0W8DEI4_PHYNI|nr:Ankyrin-2 [Phytophthora nicotianae]